VKERFFRTFNPKIKESIMGKVKQIMKNTAGFSTRLVVNSTAILVRTPFTGVRAGLLVAGTVAKFLEHRCSDATDVALAGADKVHGAESAIDAVSHNLDAKVQRWQGLDPEASSYFKKREAAEEKAAAEAEGETPADLKAAKGTKVKSKSAPAEKKPCQYCKKDYAKLEEHEQRCQEQMIAARAAAMGASGGPTAENIRQAIIDTAVSKDQRKGIREYLMDTIKIEEPESTKPATAGSVLQPTPAV
jgi:hypothetical protein